MRTRAEVLVLFPPLTNDDRFEICSEFDRAYNCFAFAAGDTSSRWDPAPTTVPTRAGLFWPDGVPLLYTLNAYLAAYATLGYEECGSGNLEPGFEKIALYLGNDGAPSHAARQRPDGTWMSKLGAGVDVRHGTLRVVGTGNDDPPDGVGNQLNGEPAVFLKRASAKVESDPSDTSENDEEGKEGDAPGDESSEDNEAREVDNESGEEGSATRASRGLRGGRPRAAGSRVAPGPTVLRRLDLR